MFFNIQSFSELIFRLIAVILALTFHEFSHGLAAYLMGDDTARSQGRLTLNPLKHIDIFGCIMLLLVGFGWAKPVGVNPMRFKNPKAGMAITALAGPVSNFILAFIFYVLALVVQINATGANGQIGQTAIAVITFFSVCISMNIGLGIFNMIPVPPLDGSRVVTAFLPDRMYFGIMRYERYIMIGLMALLFLNVLDVPLSFLFAKVWDGISFLAEGLVSLFV
ncbi:MAG: site-2 protease family protein [Clostridia bacterium]|nr:site-2 protease family protein [Clostridia bacterium]